MKEIERIICKRIIDYLETPQKAALVFGARRVGKTILINQVFKKNKTEALVLNGEDYDVQALLEDRSAANYRRLLAGKTVLAIDEAQAIPDIGRKIKLILDEVSGIRVIASGSSSFDLQNKAGEPLVGRSAAFYLTPFSLEEIATQEDALTVRQNLENRLIYGSYPEVTLMESPRQKEEYLREIVGAYLLKDILTLDGLRNSSKMRDLCRLIAFQTGNEVSLDELGRQLSMSKTTVEKYLDLLSKVFVLFRLGAYARNLRKEVAKTGKWYFYDNGIRNAVIGNFSPLALRQDIGALWESWLIGERFKNMYNTGISRNHYFWRTHDKQEIDLIEESANELSAFEFKWGDKSPKIPAAFTKAYPHASYKIINQKTYESFLTDSPDE
ncbi:MAG: ATP-binding protein [Treponema sp.]|jgi:predicted AAA+ superfamily ATPase|nr:ATP-binding protein [Treponema sp.]